MSAHRAERNKSGALRFGVALLTGLVVAGTAFYLVRSGDDGSTPHVQADDVVVVPSEEVKQPRIANKTSLAAGEKSDRKHSRLVIDSIGVDAPMGETSERVGWDGPEVVIPDDVSQVAWLNTAAHPGDLIGSSLVTGHVSDVRDAPGALYRLKEVEVGDLVEWHHEGRKWTFVITGTATYPRSGELPPELVDTSRERTLYIVTCDNRETLPGGGFTYRDNLVVKAELYGAIEGF